MVKSQEEKPEKRQIRDINPQLKRGKHKSESKYYKIKKKIKKNINISFSFLLQQKHQKYYFNFILFYFYFLFHIYNFLRIMRIKSSKINYKEINYERF